MHFEINFFFTDALLCETLKILRCHFRATHELVQGETADGLQGSKNEEKHIKPLGRLILGNTF